ncbi:hypothetical protein HHL28_00890 [Aerophototrophica crusticola]|uniref:Uncharacterized protein n=1 Tax=Aerophototrophica crusticola TaxID=1709002 RepID=A0A858R397_9PROT|nr:hypothetical protein HHL28_00890 [Rhodospirillaceae bacterium B3]
MHARPHRTAYRDPAARQAEAKALYRALQDLAREAMELSQAAARDPAHFRKHPYRGFREKLSEFQAIAALLRGRLEEAAGTWQSGPADPERAEKARAAFDRLELLMLSLFVRTSRRYFTFLSLDPTVPVGAVEWLRRDLPSLLDALEKLRAPAVAERVDPGLEAELTTAILILNDLIGRLPDLPDFGAGAG